MPFSLFLALKYLRPKRSFVSVVTVISILGVLLGVAILVIVLSVMTGFDEMWRDKILSFKPHLTVRNHLGAIPYDSRLSDEIMAIDGIDGVSPANRTLCLIQYRGRAAAPVVLGLDSDMAGTVTRIPEFTTNGIFDISGNNGVIGIDLARNMGLSVGDTILVHSPQNVMNKDELYLPEDLKISGIFDMGMRDFDSSFVITSLHFAGDLAGLSDGFQSIFVMTDNPFLFEKYARKVIEQIPPSYIVRTWKEEDRLMFDALSHEKTIMFILLVFITIVAIFCVMNTLIVVTVNKTNEIGLLKALGFSSGHIMGAFVWHGWIQCLVGIAAGIGTGLLVLENLPEMVKFLTYFDIEVFPKAIYGLSEIPWSTSPEELFKIGVFVMVSCTLASFLPAYRAARLDPVDALREE